MALSSVQAVELQALRKSKGQRNPRKLVIECQQLLLNDIRNKKTSPAIRAKCVIAYDKLEDRLRILKGKPLPGYLKPELQGESIRRRRKATDVLPLPEVASG